MATPGLLGECGGHHPVMQPFDSVTIFEDAGRLDRVVVPVRDAVRRMLRGNRAGDLLHGVWLGHPVHPMLVQVPLGCLLSAAVLDAAGADDRACQALIGTGLAAAVPAAAAGLADWSEMHEQQQRVGLVHAAANTVGLALHAASLVARRSGNRGRGVVLSFTGLAALGVGGALGGHLSYRQAAGANHAEDIPHLVPAGWHDLCAIDDLPPDGTPTMRPLGTVPLLVLRRGRDIDVLSNRCSHLSGPLHEGTLADDATCITCPWHGSTFRLHDGAVVHGPATAPVHAFDVRVHGGRVEVRLPGAG